MQLKYLTLCFIVAFKEKKIDLKETGASVWDGQPWMKCFAFSLNLNGLLNKVVLKSQL